MITLVVKMTIAFAKIMLMHRQFSVETVKLK